MRSKARNIGEGGRVPARPDRPGGSILARLVTRRHRTLGERVRWALIRTGAWTAVVGFGLAWSDWHTRVSFG